MHRESSRIRSTTILAVRRNGKGRARRRRPGDCRRHGHEVQRAEGARPREAASCSPDLPAPPPTRSRCSRNSRRSSRGIPDNLPRAAVELAKDWRSDRVLRRLEALLAVDRRASMASSSPAPATSSSRTTAFSRSAPAARTRCRRARAASSNTELAAARDRAARR